ncbi:MAG: hypothetical protein HT579_16455 [Candidatus Accumulibacter similis]|nr:MAG: hypothetical protein HT579_16455 [Candidatus Accumulibacter similis]
MNATTLWIGPAVGALPSVSAAVPAYPGGAHVDGPYDPFDVTNPSGNGNGRGHAYGKPAAGTVGNADVKNPPGQLPGPVDGNSGYECDDNSGIARGNPAHSFCVPPDE